MLEILAKNYNLNIVAPFHLTINGSKFEFDCLIKGYGALNGMVVDSNAEKLMNVSEELSLLNYGFSCMDIDADRDVDTFQSVLDDWGES